MITNADSDAFDVIELTNEVPFNRIGGVGTVIEHLCSGLQTLGVRALWFLADHRYRPDEVDRILTRMPSVAIGTYEDLRRLDAPVVHLHSYHHHARLLQALRGRPLMYTIHSLLALEARSNAVDLAEAIAWQESLIRQADEVVLVSDAERNHYRRLGYDHVNSQVHVVPNGIAAPAVTGRRRGRSVVGYCGRLVPRKHPEYIPMALAEPDLGDATALVAGKYFSAYARDLLEHLGLGMRIRYLGWCGGARLEQFWAEIDVLALPATYEPFGLAALEAAARGVPVVCTAVDGLVEVLGDSAWYMEDESYPAFVDALRRFRATSREEYERRVDSARRRARERFSDVAMAAAYRDRFVAIQEEAGS